MNRSLEEIYRLIEQNIQDPKLLEDPETCCLCVQICIQTSRLLGRKKIPHEILLCIEWKGSPLDERSPHFERKPSVLRHCAIFLPNHQLCLDYTIRQFDPEREYHQPIPWNTYQTYWKTIIPIPRDEDLQETITNFFDQP